jgi:hypothetical protein
VGQLFDFVPHIHIGISINLSKRKEIQSLIQGLIILNEEKVKIKSSPGGHHPSSKLEGLGFLRYGLILASLMTRP